MFGGSVSSMKSRVPGMRCGPHGVLGEFSGRGETPPPNGGRRQEGQELGVAVAWQADVTAGVNGWVFKQQYGFLAPQPDRELKNRRQLRTVGDDHSTKQAATAVEGAHQHTRWPAEVRPIRCSIERVPGRIPRVRLG